jgi:hypothetical protein
MIGNGTYGGVCIFREHPPGNQIKEEINFIRLLFDQFASMDWLDK